MVLPERLEVNIPPSVTTIAEAAVGRDTIMRAVASAVLQVRRLGGKGRQGRRVGGTAAAWPRQDGDSQA